MTRGAVITRGPSQARRATMTRGSIGRSAGEVLWLHKSLPSF